MKRKTYLLSGKRKYTKEIIPPASLADNGVIKDVISVDIMSYMWTSRQWDGMVAP